MSGELDGTLLKVFVAIIECQGFSAAAERLHKTQSTVSQSLQRLEDIVGTPLIRRTTSMPWRRAASASTSLRRDW